MRETCSQNISDNGEAHENPFESTNKNSSLFFNDGVRSIDFVLVWRDEEAPDHVKDERDTKRLIFENNLVKEGLELESEIVEDEFHFVKV